jgi:IMP and pyridine-specific 5'-nucleotidase
LAYLFSYTLFIGYGYDGSKYEFRIQELLNKFIEEQMNEQQIGNFYVLGGECNYLFQCRLLEEEVHSQEVLDNLNQSQRSTSTAAASPSIPFIEPDASEKKAVLVTTKRARLIPVPAEEWQAEDLNGPKPFFWPAEEIKGILDTAEATMREAVSELKLRAQILRKERAVGVFPGGSEMTKKVPVGHGSKRLKQEALDEIVLRVMDAIRSRTPKFTLPYCVFNGGTDAWIDIGNKSVGVAALQAYFGFESKNSLHVGDQVYNWHFYNSFAYLLIFFLLAIVPFNWQ